MVPFLPFCLCKSLRTSQSIYMASSVYPQTGPGSMVAAIAVSKINYLHNGMSGCLLGQFRRPGSICCCMSHSKILNELRLQSGR